LATDAMTVATTAAVSVRRRCVPRVISSNPLAHAKAISSAREIAFGADEDQRRLAFAERHGQVEFACGRPRLGRQ
jgi:hypothetical protein